MGALAQEVEGFYGHLRDLGLAYGAEFRAVRALAAGASSSGFVEHLLKSGRPLADPMAEDGPGTHSNIRGSDYYH